MTKGQSDDAYQTNGVDDGDEDTSESYLEYQRNARRGEGEKGQGGAGENKQQRGQHCKGDILDYEGSSLASDKTELTNLKATTFHTKKTNVKLCLKSRLWRDRDS